jgi:hypothetical protein
VAQEGKDLPFVQVQVDPVDSDEIAKGFLQISDTHGGLARLNVCTQEKYMT